MDQTNLFDSLTMIIADDSNVLCFVNLDEMNVISLPVVKITGITDWKTVIQKEIHDLLGSSLYNELLSIHKITKIWLPTTPKSSFITNFTVHIKMSSNFKAVFAIPSIGKYCRLKWLNTRDLAKFYNLNVVGSPVLLEIFTNLKKEAKNFVTMEKPSSIQAVDCYTELNENVFSKNTGNNYIDDMIEESPLKSSRSTMYLDYLKLIFPEIFMSGGHFMKILTKFGFNRQESSNLFRAADLTNRGFLTFNEYFGICVALEPGAKHVGMCAKARSTYIFRYLNKTSDGLMSLRELKDLVVLVRKSRQLAVDAASLEKEVRETATQIGISLTKSITLLDFLKFAQDLRFRGINNILRSSKSMAPVSIKSASPTLKPPEPTPTTKPTFMPVSIERSLKSTEKWEIATHCITIRGSDIFVDNIFNNAFIPQDELHTANITVVTRKKSLESFSSQHICNELIEMTRQLAEINMIKSGNRGRTHGEYTWTPLNSYIFSQKLLSICEMVTGLISKEQRMINISSPVYILGDFHGNFGDLLQYEEVLWPLTPCYNPTGLLFLGDYVDRGFYGVELIAYLFAHKILHPDKFFLLRGNHEVREVQHMFTFYSECIAKFGDKQGKIVWETINSVFDYMPIAAVVDGQLFCCHGGIPPPWLCPTIDAIQKIPKPLPHPDLKSSLAWEMLWNDPIRDEEITKEIQIELAANDGFAQNRKRGTAHVFNNAATDNFLKKFGFSHVIRAHEMAPTGFCIFHKGKLIGVFSTSKYNGYNNESACLYVEDFSLQVIRLNPSILT